MNTRVRPPEPVSGPAASWLEMPGNIAAQLRERDWSKHALGWPGNWAPDLRAAVQLMLSSNIPAILFWGDTRIQLFNDAFAATLESEAVNAALAVPAAQANLPLWRRHWPWVEGLFAGTVRVQAGESKGGVFAERSAYSPMFVGDPANRYARGGLILMLNAPGDRPDAVHRRRQAVLDAIDEGFCVIEVRFDTNDDPADYLFLEVNPAFERLTGIVGAVGRSMRDIAPAHEQHWFDRYAEVARTGIPARFEADARELAGGKWFDVFAFRVDEPEEHHVAILFSDATERRQGTEALNDALARERQANALLDAMYDSAPIGLAFVDRDLRFQRVNPRLAEMNGRPAEEHIGKRPDELLHEVEGLQDILDSWQAVIDTGQPALDVQVHGETPAQPGVQRSWAENFYPVRVDGKIVGLGVVAEETTARLQAQEALAASEARFRALMELGPIGIAVAEPDGRVILANDALLAMLGYQRTELESLNWIERTAAESLPLDEAQLRALREGKQPVPFEKEYIRRDGSRVTALVVSQFMPGEGDRMIAYAVDITDRKKAERQVQESAARLRNIIDNMAGFVAMLDVEGVMLEVGDPALRRGGLTREEVIGRKFWECAWWTHDPEQQGRIEQWFHRARDGETIRADVVARTAHDGRTDVDFMLTPVFDAHGKVTHVIPSGLDISDRRRIEQALRENEQRLEEAAAALKEADRRKDDFLATLAHELRNPLAPIRNGIQLVRLVASTHSSLERTSVMMERQMQHLVRLVDDLLDVSRITRGKIELRREVVLVNEIVSSALETCATLFEPQGHVLSVDIAAEPLRVMGDPDRLRQIFSNLLSNAAKFSRRGGSVHVSLERADGQAVVKVRDAGIGIPPERIDRIFEMFAQIHGAQVNDGLGIGLALVKQLVALHGGTVTARSDGLGKGSEFTVALPIADVETLAAHRRYTPPDEVPSRKGRKVLIVDDNVDAADSLAAVLSLKGHSIRTANSGADAVERASRERPDVVLLDLGMSGMDGFTTAERLRSQAGSDRIRIIALTGWGQDRDRELTAKAGIDEHLVKPVDIEALNELLN